MSTADFQSLKAALMDVVFGGPMELNRGLDQWSQRNCGIGKDELLREELLRHGL